MTSSSLILVHFRNSPFDIASCIYHRCSLQTYTWNKFHHSLLSHKISTTEPAPGTPGTIGPPEVPKGPDGKPPKGPDGKVVTPTGPNGEPEGQKGPDGNPTPPDNGEFIQKRKIICQTVIKSFDLFNFFKVQYTIVRIKNPGLEAFCFFLLLTT